MSRVLLLVGVLLGACGEAPGPGSPDGFQAPPDGQPAAAALFSPAIDRLLFEIDYQTGAEPYTGSGGLMVSDVWQILRDNVARLFQGAPKQVTLPSTLAEMQQLSDVSGGRYTAEQILDVAGRHHDQPSGGGTASFYVLFLDGYFEDADGVNMNVLGVSLGDTGVIAMFKPVIAGSEGLFPGVARFVEQSTLVHELGHAIGLVDNGLPMAQPHKDAAHGAHCSDDQCVMFWGNEGADGAVGFARDALAGGPRVLFAADCLADVDAEAAARN